MYQRIIKNDVCPTFPKKKQHRVPVIDTTIDITIIVYPGSTLYLYVVQILFYDIQYSTYRSSNTVRYDTTCNGGISHCGVGIIRDTDRDLVHYGVVYAYVVVQLPFYNLQGFDRYTNGHTYDGIYDICVFNNNRL